MGAPVRPGDVLAGKYCVERVLGEGGMGVVVAARHLQLDQLVALKFLLPEAVANAEALGRFEREARIAVRLKSEHVARIIDVGTLAGGAPYIVMEFLQGTDLAGVLAQQRALPVPAAVDFVLQACDAIAEAHSLGIIHRDLKPQNLFVTRRHDGTTLVKVLDFGISKSAAGDFTATRTQAVMGSPAYMSPEQMRSAKLVDVRTDIWALGVVLYELVIGHVPWQAETFTELCFKVAMDPLPPLPSQSKLPAGFEDIVRRCLDKEPGQRFADVYELAVALLPFAPAHAHQLVERIGRVLRGQPAMSASQPTLVAAGPGTLRELAGQRATHTAVGSSRRKLVGLAIATVAVAGAGVTAVALSSRTGEVGAGTAPPPSHAAVQPPSAPPPSPLPPAPRPEPARPPEPPPSKAEPAEAQAQPPSSKAEPPAVSQPPSTVAQPSSTVAQLRPAASKSAQAAAPAKADKAHRRLPTKIVANPGSAQPPIKGDDALDSPD